MKPLLIVRAEPSAQQSMVRARERALDAHSFPLFAMLPLPWKAPDPKAYTGLMLTSANAVRLGGNELMQLRSMPVFAVGEATATAARDAGFLSLVTGDADVTRLLARLATLGPQKLLHLCGADYAAAEMGLIELDRIVVYRADLVAPPAALLAMLTKPSVIAVHSPRAGTRIASICDDHHINRSMISIVAISTKAAHAAGSGWQKLAIASKPSDEDVIEAADALCRAE